MMPVDPASPVVAVGMSGGVDSSVTAILVRETGRQVVGVTMRVYGGDLPGGCSANACYGPDEERDVEQARRVCERIGIPFVEVDLREEYRANVLDYFSREYLSGRTPNPCVRCNQLVKFGLLLDKLSSQAGVEAASFATGHYARVGFDEPSGRFTLRAGIDPAKDQSYFLCMLSQDQLSRAMFPLGGMLKSDVRRIARERGLDVHDKSDSQDFAAGDYRTILRPAPVLREGYFRNARGEILGSHRGIWAYTIGQRRGLGLSAGEPLYVTGIDPDTDTVFVGPAGELSRGSLLAADVNWVSVPRPSAPIRAQVRIRSQQRAAAAMVTSTPEGAEVRFDEPQRAIAAGQWAVFYQGDLLLGGGVIEKSW